MDVDLSNRRFGAGPLQPRCPSIPAGSQTSTRVAPAGNRRVVSSFGCTEVDTRLLHETHIPVEGVFPRRNPKAVFPQPEFDASDERWPGEITLMPQDRQSGDAPGSSNISLHRIVKDTSRPPRIKQIEPRLLVLFVFPPIFNTEIHRSTSDASWVPCH